MAARFVREPCNHERLRTGTTRERISNVLHSNTAQISSEGILTPESSPSSISRSAEDSVLSSTDDILAVEKFKNGERVYPRTTIPAFWLSQYFLLPLSNTASSRMMASCLGASTHAARTKTKGAIYLRDNCVERVVAAEKKSKYGAAAQLRQTSSRGLPIAKVFKDTCALDFLVGL